MPSISVIYITVFVYVCTWVGLEEVHVVNQDYRWLGLNSFNPSRIDLANPNFQVVITLFFDDYLKF